MNNKFYLKQVELKSGKITVVASYEDYGSAVDDMVALSSNDGKYSYFVSAYC